MPFQKGQSGNPGGRRKDASFVDTLIMRLKELEGDNTRGLRKIAEELIMSAEGGDLQAIKEVADRLDGKPKQTLDANVSDARLSQAELDARIIELFGLLSQGAIARASGDEVRTNGKSKPH